MKSRPTSKMAMRSRNACGPTRQGRCSKPGPIVRNPYLNFLRQFRKKNCGLSPTETIRQGAKEWKSLTKEQRLRFIEEAFYAPKRRRRYTTICRPASRQRRSSKHKRSAKASMCRPSRPRRRAMVC